MTEQMDDCGRHAGEAGVRSRLLIGEGMLGRRPPNGVRAIAACVWLGFVIFPLLNAIGKHGPALEHGLVIGGATVFIAGYVLLVLRWRDDSAGVPLAVLALLLAVSTALTISQASGWGFLFTYCAAVAAMATPQRIGFYAVLLCAALAGATSAVGGADGGAVVGFIASSAGIGMLMLVMRDLRVRNMELSAARAELARLAVAEERERFARDLHDLLGHSLSVIALKAELAGRLLVDGPSDAVREVGELEQVARTALGEVREAVSGYRQPTLAGEIAGARMALSAAGIEADVQETRAALDPPVEAVLAWAVREGATNVIRHSGARHCTLKISTSLTDAGVEVIDDGRGVVTNGNGPGLPSTGVAGSAGTQGGAGYGHVAGGAGYGHVAGGAGYGHVAGGAGTPSGAGHGQPTGAGGNGHPVFGAGGAGGHGLAGLAERARLLNGWIEAGTLADGGYRLAVTVPVSHA
jgi:two-component system, NarL family, sensor histidine kinase DesK